MKNRLRKNFLQNRAGGAFLRSAFGQVRGSVPGSVRSDDRNIGITVSP